MAGAAASLTLVRRTLTPQDLMIGTTMFGPGPAGAGEDPGQDNADATVAAAVAAGIKEFDTAPWYGAGSSEERLGRALAPFLASGARAFTKVGRLVRQPDRKTPCTASFEAPESTPLNERVWCNDYTGAGSRASLSESLARMRLHSLYGLRIHDANDNSTSDSSVDEVGIALGSNGACAELRQMREDGLIEHASLGMNCNREPHQGVPDDIIRMIRGVPDGTFDSALLAGGWNLLTQAGLPCFLECEQRNIPVHVAGVFASGLLVGGSTYAYKQAPPEMVEKTERWRTLAQKHGHALPAVAIAFAALPKCVTRIVIGVAGPVHVQETLTAVEASNKVPVELWAEARQLGLVDVDLALPM